MPTPLTSNAFAFADGNAGHSCDLGSSPSAGQWDVLCVNSNTTVSTPSGFTAAESAVTNQGAYIFVREAAGGEGQTVTITTSGNHNTHVCHSRWDSTLTAVDTSTNTQANSSAGNTTPTHTTGTLAETGELVIAFAALHSIGTTANQTGLTWSTGYTEINGGNQGTGVTGVRGSVAYRENRGTAAEAPQLTWSGDGCFNRYMLAVTFTVTSASTHTGTLAGTFPALTGVLAGLAGKVGALVGTFPSLTGTLAGVTGKLGTLSGAFPALQGSLEGTGGAIDLPPTPDQIGNSGWQQLLSIVHEARQMRAEDDAAPPVACPNDGEPLLTGPDGILFCRFDGWKAS